mmetsp:Transcript_133/g.183  ORF Transcript_133/g.183 Transcript_133/m.183 type:complete len:623 (+) Transcript_133:49-1917(+)
MSVKSFQTAREENDLYDKEESRSSTLNDTEENVSPTFSVDTENFDPLEDVFTIFYVSPVLSLSFLYSVGIFFLQIGILILALFNLIKNGRPGNILYIPPMTSVDVIIAQLFAIFVTVMTASDVFDSLEMSLFRYPDRELTKKHFPHAKKWKWILSNLMRFFEGILSIAVAFVFVSQSNDVLDLFLDFAVVQFVSELDNIGFYLANQGSGRMGYDLKNTTVSIQKNLRYQALTRLKGKRQLVATGLNLFILILLLTLWITSQIFRFQGRYFDVECQHFHIQFLDSIEYDFFRDHCGNPTALSMVTCPDNWVQRTDPINYQSFHDVYIAKRTKNGKGIELHDNRPQYYQRGFEGMDAFGPDSPPGKISYCKDENAWIFSIEGVNKGVEDQQDTSCNWLLRSPRTDAYLLHDVPTDGWIAWSGTIDPINDIIISCVECEGNENNLALGCTYHGKCKNQVCQCEDHWIGSQCETCAACTNFNLKSSTLELNGTITNTDEDYRRLDQKNSSEPYDVYGRAVYYKLLNGTIDPGLRVFLYTGYNYVELDLGQDASQGNDLDELRSLLDKFHSTWDIDVDDSLVFTSENTDAHLPFNLKWTSNTDSNLQNLNFTCVDGNETNFCSFAFN